MAKFRQNHQNQGKDLQTTFRMVILLFVVIAALAGGFIYYRHALFNKAAPSATVTEDYADRTYLPSSSGEVVNHRYYSLSYMEKYEQAEWTAYMMTREMLNAENVDRNAHFNPDYSVSTRSAYHRDYSNSGYTRGHLVPAADMAFDTLAMRESFFMSNMSPQVKECNNGVWKELEENVRDWTYKAGTLYIVSGPVINGAYKTIGKENKVAVPHSFYKVLLDYEDPERKMIGFVIPNALSEIRLQDYMVTVDSVEKLTGIDFFKNMINDAEEEKLESTINKSNWNVSEKRYQLRVTKWNYE